MKFIVRIVISFIALLMSFASIAQTYPNKPVRIIVPFASGGPTDAMARILAQKFTESMGQTFVVENRAGAGGNIGMGMGAKAAPDGYTLTMVSSSFVVNPSLYASVPYDAYKDFLPISLAGASPNLIVVEGHTDNRPVTGRAYPSNWELSSFKLVLSFIFINSFYRWFR